MLHKKVKIKQLLIQNDQLSDLIYISIQIIDIKKLS
jgi:hypothetical protein